MEILDDNYKGNKMLLPKDIEKYEVKYSEKGLMKKLTRVARRAGMKVVYNVLLLYYAVQSPSVSTKDKSIILGALGYFIFPLDMLSDFIPFAGYADDYAALAWAISKVLKNVTPQVKEQAKARLQQWFKAETD